MFDKQVNIKRKHASIEETYDLIWNNWYQSFYDM